MRTVRQYNNTPRLRIRAVVVLAIALSISSLTFGWDERLGTVQDFYDGSLPLGVEVNTFRHIDRVFPSVIVRRGIKAAPLPRAASRLIRRGPTGTTTRAEHMYSEPWSGLQ